jgi:circadian clock protein KaiB
MKLCVFCRTYQPLSFVSSSKLINSIERVGIAANEAQYVWYSTYPGGPIERRLLCKQQEPSSSPVSFDLEENSMNKQVEDSPGYNLRLYIAGQTPRSIAAVSNLRKLCETYLSGRYRLDVIDLMAEPNRAQRDRIVAVPTLVGRRPGAVTRIIGDLSNSERVLDRLKIDVRAKARR